MVDCTIIMLAHNAADYTVRCLGSVLTSRPLPAAVIAVNNGSTDDTASRLTTQGERFAAAGIGWTVLTNDANMGCSDARNAAWRLVRTRYTVFIDNDTVVRSLDWLGQLSKRLDQEPDLGVISPVMVYPWRPHLIQCAGVDINPAGRVRFRGRGQPIGTPPFDQPADLPALISACWVMRTELLAATGGLDPLFHPVQYEDLDFCMRVRQLGMRCACTPAVEIYHFEGTTTASRGRDDYVRTILANSAKFRQRWRDALRQLPDLPGDWSWHDRDSFALTDILDLTPASPAPAESATVAAIRRDA